MSYSFLTRAHGGDLERCLRRSPVLTIPFHFQRVAQDLWGRFRYVAGWRSPGAAQPVQGWVSAVSSKRVIAARWSRTGAVRRVMSGRWSSSGLIQPSAAASRSSSNAVGNDPAPVAEVAVNHRVGVDAVPVLVVGPADGDGLLEAVVANLRGSTIGPLTRDRGCGRHGERPGRPGPSSVPGRRPPTAAWFTPSSRRWLGWVPGDDRAPTPGMKRRHAAATPSPAAARTTAVLTAPTAVSPALAAALVLCQGI